ncbi:MAG: hypothetical protein J2P57_24305 [Acidimicrobiaceae bacterium]|nr:hypothetical protein [Acidimicrobiaceae bacterium]
MAWEPDFRSEAMDSPEGKGIARDRYESFMDEHLEALVEFYLDPRNPPPKRYYVDDDELPAEILDKFSEQAREESEAIGFWVAWHLAGGFSRLEAAGWHRATIYRKLHRFRARYGAHPDEFVFPHIKLNYAGYWEDQIRREFEPQEPPDLDELEG